MNPRREKIIPRFFAAVSMTLALLTAGTSTERKTAPKDNVLIERSNSDEILLEVIPKAYGEVELKVDGKSMQQLSALLSGSTSEAGRPDLPVEGHLFAVPPGRRPAVEIVESKFVIEEGKVVAPAPYHTFTAEGEAVPGYRVDREFYETHNQFYPSTTAEITDVTQLRNFRVARVIVHPVQYNPVTKQLKRFVHLKLRIRFQQDAGTGGQVWTPLSDPDPCFEDVYKNLILNYQDAQSWGGRYVKTVSSLLVDSTAGWFQTGRTYYRIPVGADGLYRLSYNTLLNNGIDLTRLNNATAALYSQGQSVPLVVQTQDSLPQNWYMEFYARRRYGTSSYYNRYSDTSMYWLTWNDPNPRRYTDGPANAIATPDTTRWYMETSHQEKDLNYFFGVTQDDIENTDDVPGEGWYWQAFVSGQTFNFPFTLDTLQRSTGVPVQLKARFYGMTICQSSSCKSPSRQSALLYVNKRFVGELDWTDNNEAFFTGTFPDSILRAGLDTVQISSKTWSPADSNISEFYLDWFEVNYPRPIKALNGSVLFTVPAPGKDTIAYVVKGIPRDSASIYDLTGGRRILNLLPYGSQAFVFSDTASTQKAYYVVKQSSKLTPAYMVGKTFSNLRVNTRGSDYIVITHSLFRSEANRLAQYRASANKLRTAVVDVQDIYDEFNYGLLDPVAIRSFLKTSYYSWKHPSPATVVLFGDASWDYKMLMPTSVKINYVPSYGNPPSDNALVCFDSVKNYIPFMLVGRIPVENTTEADQVVSKIINYEATPAGDWSKSYLFLTAGDDPSEKATFNYWSDDLVNRYVTDYPFGGLVYKVYKSTDAIIDGENKQFMQDRVNNGVVFVNYIGHSGGRIWALDIGSPSGLQNTNGQLPFVSSVSCNVGFFSDPTQNVLSEDFLMADNRGAIAVWAASSIGYGSVGRVLDDKFLSAATVNAARNLGLLTTISRLNFWIINGVTTPLVIQAEHLHPLIGDPYSPFGVPLRPDFAVTADGVVLRTQPATADSTITLSVAIKNSGLMAGVPILVSIQDSYVNEKGQYKGTSDAVPQFYIPDFVWQDSFKVSFNVQGKPGFHTVTINIDPKDSIIELRKDNNIVQKSFYVYRNRISAVKPPPMGVISSVSPTFVATVPAGSDTTPLSFTFSIDTVPDFSSPARIVSPTIIPGKVAASWQAPALQSNQIYYWSSQSTGGSTQGVPITSSFRVASPGPGADTVVWRQSRSGQFQVNQNSLVSVTDTGVTMLRTDSVELYARSLGYRADMNHDYYGILQIGNVKATGMWWDDAYSYLLGRYDATNGAYRLKGYNLLTPGEIDSMTAFLNQTPVGNYVMLSAVEDAKQNVTDSLYKLIQALGSASIRSVQAGQSWLMISRKGDGTAIIEDYKPSGTAIDSLVIPNVFSSGSGQVLSQPIGPASKWIKATWNAVTPSGKAIATLRVLGLKNNGLTDTLTTVSNGVFQVDLTGISPRTYPKLQLLAKLSNLDGSTTPTLKRWDVTYLPTADLAVSAWSFSVTPAIIASGGMVNLSLDVYNIGYERADSVSASFYPADDTTQRATVVLDSIAVGSQRHIQSQMKVTGSGTRTIMARVDPKPGSNDLLSENNVVGCTILVQESQPGFHSIRVLFDNVEIHDGEFVSPRPAITILPSTGDSSREVDVRPMLLFIDKNRIAPSIAPAASTKDPAKDNVQEVTLNSLLADGEHTLEVYEPGPSGQPRAARSDNLVRSLKFQTSSLAQLLNVYNYPNPFASQTVFTFKVTGIQVPDEVRIKVYTVAGRLIRDVDVDQSQLHLDINNISWDGRDQDGDEVANGVYLYRVTMKSGDKTATATEKLARVR